MNQIRPPHPLAVAGRPVDPDHPDRPETTESGYEDGKIPDEHPGDRQSIALSGLRLQGRAASLRDQPG
ncbi:hypothetical protein [Streptosporangium sp. KLBMP 9127]|nr:hypothetical protein [Streptosporangium sp. KLBMP 9127]